MEHCAGRSVHLTPSGLDFDEQRVQLVRSCPPCSLRFGMQMLVDITLAFSVLLLM